MVIPRLVQVVSPAVWSHHTSLLVVPDEGIIGVTGKSVYADLKWKTENTRVFEYMVTLFIHMGGPKLVR